MSTGNISRKAEVTKLFVRHGNIMFNTFVPVLDEKKILTTREREKIFTLLWGAAKGFMKALKAFIKPFEVPEKSVKRKI